MKDDSDSPTGDGTIPLHVYLRMCRDMHPEVTNIDIARALGYEKANVIAMMFTGSMKVPLNKVAGLARILELDPVALLRRVLYAYNPAMLEVLEDDFGARALLTSNEKALLDHVRGLMGADDLAVMEDRRFVEDFTTLLLKAQDRHFRSALAEGTVDRAERDARNAKLNSQMIALLRRQAAERGALLQQYGDGDSAAASA